MVRFVPACLQFYVLMSSRWLSTTLAALLKASRARDATAMERTAASNVLCGLVDLSTESNDSAIAPLIFSPQVASALLDLCLDYHDSARIKSSKQVLTTLARIYARSENVYGNHDLRNENIHRIFELLFHGSEQSKAKPALLALVLFLSKKVVSSGELIDLYSSWLTRDSLVQKYEARRLSNIEEIMNGLLKWVMLPDVAPAVGQLMPMLFDQIHEVSRTTHRHVNEEYAPEPWWADIVLNILIEHVGSLTTFRIYIFPGLFKPSFIYYLAFVQRLGLDSVELPDEACSNVKYMELKRLILLAALQTGKELGFVEERG